MSVDLEAVRGRCRRVRAEPDVSDGEARFQPFSAGGARRRRGELRAKEPLTEVEQPPVALTDGELGELVERLVRTRVSEKQERAHDRRLIETALPRVEELVSVGDSHRASAGWYGERGLARLRHFGVAFPALVLELEVLYGDRVGVGVEVGERLVLRHPAPEQLV